MGPLMSSRAFEAGLPVVVELLARLGQEEALPLDEGLVQLVGSAVLCPPYLCDGIVDVLDDVERGEREVRCGKVLPHGFHVSVSPVHADYLDAVLLLLRHAAEEVPEAVRPLAFREPEDFPRVPVDHASDELALAAQVLLVDDERGASLHAYGLRLVDKGGHFPVRPQHAALRYAVAGGEQPGGALRHHGAKLLHEPPCHGAGWMDGLRADPPVRVTAVAPHGGTLHFQDDIRLVVRGVPHRDAAAAPVLHACPAERTIEIPLAAELVLDNDRVILTMALGGSPPFQLECRNYVHKSFYHASQRGAAPSPITLQN